MTQASTYVLPDRSTVRTLAVIDCIPSTRLTSILHSSVHLASASGRGPTLSIFGAGILRLMCSADADDSERLRFCNRARAVMSDVCYETLLLMLCVSARRQVVTFDLLGLGSRRNITLRRSIASLSPFHSSLTDLLTHREPPLSRSSLLIAMRSTYFDLCGPSLYRSSYITADAR